MVVPFFNLSSVISPYTEELLSSIEEDIGATDFILGNKVSTFEKKLATKVGANYAVGVI